MTKLSDRVEALTGPDREVDRAIAPLVGIRIVNEGPPLGSCYYDEKGHGVPLPLFTASIDAAMTLVREEYRWCVDTCDDRPRSFVEPPHPYEGQPFWGNAATPSLALTAAALRARGL